VIFDEHAMQGVISTEEEEESTCWFTSWFKQQKKQEGAEKVSVETPPSKQHVFQEQQIILATLIHQLGNIKGQNFASNPGHSAQAFQCRSTFHLHQTKPCALAC